MLSEQLTHTYPLDETMYGGTLTVGDNEVSYGDVMCGKTDTFMATLPDMFSVVGAEGNMINSTMSSFPVSKKARRK